MIEWEKKQLVIEKKELIAYFLYTPMCGTCQVSKRMLTVISDLLPALIIYSVNLNYYPKEAMQLEITSVPCLLIFEDGVEKERVYAFQSVSYLHALFKQYIH